MDRFGDSVALAELLGDWSAGRGPLYRKLAGALRQGIEGADIPVGHRLPSERHLAAALAVSRATVVAAYDDLRAEGVLESRQGSGTRVSPQVGGRVRARGGIADGRVPGGRGTAIFQRLIDGPGPFISLTCAAEAGAPQIADALIEVAREDLPDLLADPGYHARGLPVLREAVAAHLSSAGISTCPDEVLVTNGAHQAIVLVTELYVPKGATVVVEAPSWPGCIDVFRAAGARLVGVPLDDEGIEASGVEAALDQNAPALLYVMPTYHNPTGVLMSKSRRRQIAELAARYDVPVLEDNAYSAFSQADPQAPLAAYAAPGCEVLTVGSLGKAIWGGLRSGWVRAPAEVIERLARRKALADLGSPLLDQALAARLLREIDTLTAARDAELGRRLILLERLLHERLPTWRWRTPDGGAALWVELPGVDASVYAQVALRHGVEIVPGSAMDPDGGHDTFLRIPFTFTPDVLAELVRRLARAWTELARHGPADTRPLLPVV